MAQLNTQIRTLSPHTRQIDFTKHLPDELLSVIFEYSYPQYGKNPLFKPEIPFDRPKTLLEQEHLFPLLLGMVCADWRRISRSTPSLWTYFELNVNRCHLTRTNFFLPQLYFVNAGAKPMNIILDFQLFQHFAMIELACINENVPPTRGLDAPLLVLLRDLVFSQNASRVTSLGLSCLPPEWLPYLGETFSSLKNIALWWPSGGALLPPQPISLLALPSLDRVLLQDVPVNVMIPQHVTSLTLQSMSMFTAGELLISLPNLIEFRASAYSYSLGVEEAMQRLPSHEITLSYLQFFQWEWNYGDYNEMLFNILHLPALRCLLWVDHEDISLDMQEDFQDCRRRFFSRLPAANVHLHVDGPEYVYPPYVADRLLDFIDPMQQLTQLTFSDPRRSPSDVVGIFLRLLTQGDEQGNPLLPNLQVLELKGERPMRLGVQLWKWIWSRKTSGISAGLCVKLPDHGESPRIPFQWPPIIRAFLIVITRRLGFRLEVIEGGRQVGWLTSSGAS